MSSQANEVCVEMVTASQKAYRICRERIQNQHYKMLSCPFFKSPKLLRIASTIRWRLRSWWRRPGGCICEVLQDWNTQVRKRKCVVVSTRSLGFEDSFIGEVPLASGCAEAKLQCLVVAWACQTELNPAS